MKVIKIIIFLIIFFPFLLMAEAPTSDVETNSITGIVFDDAGAPLRAATIQLFIDGKLKKYTLSDNNGNFKISIDPSCDMGTSLQVSKIGFETEHIHLAPPYHPLEIFLPRAAVSLKEVTVSAPEVRLRGDTVSYLLSAFTSNGDISLKDALKKIPGLEVDKSGRISYNGKDISNFYIEGMDLLGGKYDIATSNIPVTYVNAVEVISNHHDIKIDQGTFSNKVALNIRLKSQAMFKPTGTYSIGGGIGHPIPWEASGAGMMFRKDSQSILTLKGSDIEEFSERETNTFYHRVNSSLKDLTLNAIPLLSASEPH